MDHKKVLKRAWNILWAYKALWVFGLIMALVVGGNPAPSGDGRNGLQLDGGNNSNGGSSEWTTQDFLRSMREQLGQAGEEFSRFWEGTVVPNTPAWLIGLAIAVGVFILIAMVVSTFLRYMTETSLIRMVDDYEAGGGKVSVGKGFRLGWSRRAWRMFLIDLAVGIPVGLAFFLLFVLAIAPVFLWATENETLGVLGTIATIGFFFLWIILIIVVSIALALLNPFFRRACVMEDLGVGASIRRGWTMVREHFKDAILMGLILFGINLVFGIITAIAAVIMGAAGLLTGGLIGLAAGLLAAIGSSGATPWVFGALFGATALAVVVGIPLWFLRGQYLTYVSSTWTLTYREMLALDAIKEDVVEPAPPEIPSAT